MSVRYITAVRNARLDAFIAAIGTSGLLRIFTGTQPATGGAQTTLLVELTFDTVAAPAAAAGAVTFNTIIDGVGVVTGSPTWGRFCTPAGAAVADCTAGVADPTKDLDFDFIVSLGGQVACTSLVVTDGSP